MSRTRTPLIESRVGQTLLVLVTAIGLPTLIGFTTANRRGWAVGLVCGLTFAALFTAGFWPSLRGWSRAHPLLDGAVLGPLVFVFAVYISPLPVWACVLFGAAGVGIGLLLGVRRRNRWRLQDESKGGT